MKIRPASPRDLPSLAAIAAAVSDPRAVRGHLPRGWTAAELRSLLSHPAAHALVADEDGPRGFVLYWLEDFQSVDDPDRPLQASLLRASRAAGGRMAVCEAIATAPRFGRRGVGSLLYSALEDRLRRQGIDYLFAVLPEEGRGVAAIQRFHRFNGFRALGGQVWIRPLSDRPLPRFSP